MVYNESVKIKNTLLLVEIFTVIGVISPFSAYAQLGSTGNLIPTLPFGGKVSYTLPCTCPGTMGNLWIFLTPGWFGQGTVPLTGAVVYVPYTSKLYSWYEIGAPFTWHLGNYTPGVQACWMLVPPPGAGCFLLPAAGVIREVGTSKSI